MPRVSAEAALRAFELTHHENGELKLLCAELEHRVQELESLVQELQAKLLGEPD